MVMNHRFSLPPIMDLVSLFQRPLFFPFFLPVCKQWTQKVFGYVIGQQNIKTSCFVLICFILFIGQNVLEQNMTKKSFYTIFIIFSCVYWTKCVKEKHLTKTLLYCILACVFCFVWLVLFIGQNILRLSYKLWPSDNWVWDHWFTG